jgi:Fibronectin type III domain
MGGLTVTSTSTVALRNAPTALLRNALLAVIAAVCTVAMLASGDAQAAINHPYTGTSFGPGGVGSGNFGGVVGVTVDSRTGDVLVLDRSEGGRLYKFDSGGEPVDFSSSGSNAIEGVGSAEGAEEQVAVDDSTGPDAGDIYVANNSGVRIYGENGSYLEELSGGEMCGVAVDLSGNVYVGIYPETVRRYAPSSSPVTNGDENGSIVGVAKVCNVAADQAGNVYVAAPFGGGVTKYDALQFGSLSPVGTVVDGSGRTLAVDQESEEVFADSGHGIAQYDTSVQPPKSLGSSGAGGTGALEGSFGVAVNHETGELYAGDGSRVEIFGAPEAVPSAQTEGAGSLTDSQATLHGTVEPAGVEVTSCVFEYGESTLDHSVPCAPATPYAASPVAVSAVIGGLRGGTVYHYRVFATSSHATYAGEELSFTTAGPSVAGETFTQVGSTGATISAQIDPHGVQTSYRVEYGTSTSTSYGSATPPVSVGSVESGVPVVVHLSELQPGSPYHFRFVATSSEGTGAGLDVAFTTHMLSTPGLPDGRGYEMVTPAEDEGAEAYVPFFAKPEGKQDINAYFPFAASADGNAVTYVGAPTSTGNGSQGNGGGNQFLASRDTDGGWTQTNIQPKGYPYPVYWGFSTDLEHAVLGSPEPLTPDAPPKGTRDLYVRDNASGSYRPLFTGTPPNRSPSYEFGAPFPGGEAYEQSLGEHYAGGSADFSHVLFEANDVLASGAVDPGVSYDNLYDSVDGQPRTVNVLPDGAAAPNASFGAPPTPVFLELDFSHVISTDGSRIFWTDLNTGSLYVREDDARTTLIAEEATYLTASADGSRVLYKKGGDLYEDDLGSGMTRDLAPGGEVLGLAGGSEDLEYIYVVAQASLTAGSTAGQPNLYLLHAGHTQFIATLGSEEEEKEGFQEYTWQSNIGRRTAQATPSGHGLVFTSMRSLTRYDNVNPHTGSPVKEVYVYNADNGGLSCASCDPSGVAPSGPGILPFSGFATYQLRSISEDGSKVFFESVQPLVPQAQNGRMNVYEWERDGSGSCGYAEGCIYLLSSGTSPYPSYLIDASANGNDVFLVTRSEFVAADQNEYNDVYDARVGATEAPVPTQCTGTGCQGVAAAPPVFATPASVTYNGVGNFATPSTPMVKPKAKKKPSSCKSTQKGGSKKSKAKRAKSKRALCKARKAATRVRRGTNDRGGR